MASGPRQDRARTDLVGFFSPVIQLEPSMSRAARDSRRCARATTSLSGGLVDSRVGEPSGEHYAAANGTRVRLANREAQTVRGPPAGCGKQREQRDR